MNTDIQSLAYISPYAWIVWAVFLAAYVPEFVVIARSKPAAGEETDRGSMTLIILASWLAFPASFTVASWSKFALLNHRMAWFTTDIMILLAGSMLRRYCFRTLGRYFTGNVRVQADQPATKDGPYRLVRHPSYTGGMLMYLGTGLALTNWLRALVVVGGWAPSPMPTACTSKSNPSQAPSDSLIWNTCGEQSGLFRSYSDAGGNRLRNS